MSIKMSALIFFSAFLDMQSIRKDEATTSEELFFFNPLTDVRLLHGKHKFKLQTGKKGRSLKASELFQKYPKAPNFNYLNNRLFKSDSVVPGTSNNQGLTVQNQMFTVSVSFNS